MVSVNGDLTSRVVPVSHICSAVEFDSRGNHMNRLILGIGAIVLSVMYFAEPAAAQEAGDLTGSWELTIEAPQRGGGGGGGRGGGRRGGRRGGGPQTLVIHVDDSMLSGAIESEQGTNELKNIKLEGNTITFTVVRETQRGSTEATYTGVIDGDTMKGTMEAGGGRFTINWTAERIET